MGEPGAGDIKMRRIGMIDRRQHAALGEDRVDADGAAVALGGDQLGQPLAAGDRLLREVIDRTRPQNLKPLAVLDRTNRAPAAFGLVLNEVHVVRLLRFPAA